MQIRSYLWCWLYGVDCTCGPQKRLFGRRLNKLGKKSTLAGVWITSGSKEQKTKKRKNIISTLRQRVQTIPPPLFCDSMFGLGKVVFHYFNYFSCGGDYIWLFEYSEYDCVFNESMNVKKNFTMNRHFDFSNFPTFNNFEPKLGIQMNVNVNCWSKNPVLICHTFHGRGFHAWLLTDYT